jgi:hypothetical protein
MSRNRRGIHPKVVSERLGHANVQITLDTYSHIAPDLQREAATTLDEILTGSEGKEVFRNRKISRGLAEAQLPSSNSSGDNASSRP